MQRDVCLTLRVQKGLAKGLTRMPDPKPEHARYSLEDVLDVGAKSIRSSLGSAEDQELDFAAIDGVIERTRSALTVPKRDVTGSDLDPTQEEDEGGRGIGAVELEQLVAILETGSGDTQLENTEAALLECASILLHEAHKVRVECLGSDSVRAVAQRVETALRGVPPESVTPFLQASLVDMAEALPHDEFDVWMQAVSPMLRRAIPLLLDRLSEFAISASPHGRAAFWPYVVDEFLLALGSRQGALDPRVHALEPEELEQACARLGELQALGKGLLAPGGFKIAQTFAHSIVLTLMRSPAAHRFGPLLFAAFRETPPADPGARACVFACRRYESSLGWILTEQLGSIRTRLSPDAERAAAWVLYSELECLEPERRLESWLPEALEWLGFRDVAGDPPEQTDPTRSLFERIANTRRGLKHEWNRECRKIARRVLKEGAYP